MRKFLPPEERPPAGMKTPWGLRFLDSQKREGSAKYRLIAFHHAGGSASAFRLWDRELGNDIALVAVELPGHSSRNAEPLLTDIHQIARQAAIGLLQFIDRPFFVFGHSFGAWIAFETLKIWSKQYNIAPLCFFASGGIAPHMPRIDPPVHVVTDNDEFDKILVDRYQDTTLETLRKEYPELLAALRKNIRADMTAYETYTLQDKSPLSCPIRVFSGSEDHKLVSNPNYLDEWQLYATPSTTESTTLIPGGHFYFATDAKPVVSVVLRYIKAFAV